MNCASWLRVVLPALLLAATGSFSVLSESTVLAQDKAPACTHFVAADGDDSNDGREDGPWATVQHAADNAGPGDVVCVAEGTYGGEDGLTLEQSGEEEAPIIFQVLPELERYFSIGDLGATVIQGGVDIRPGVSHLHLVGFTIRDFPVWGVSLAGDNQDIRLAYLDIQAGEAGVHMTVGESGQPPLDGPVEGVLVEWTVVRSSLYTAVDCTPGPCNDITFRHLEIFHEEAAEVSYASDGIAVEQGDNLLVEGCFIHHIGGDGIDLNSRDLMLGNDVEAVLVRNNRVYDVGLNGIKLWRGGRAENNIVLNPGNTALVLEAGARYDIINNTFADVNGYTYQATVGYDPGPGPISARIVNNIFYNSNPAMGGVLLYISANRDAIELDHNLFFNTEREEVICAAVPDADDVCATGASLNNGSWAAASGFGVHNFSADPRFVDMGTGDLRLGEDSPARDMGTLEGAPAEDIDGQPRPAGPGVDLGAHQEPLDPAREN